MPKSFHHTLSNTTKDFKETAKAVLNLSEKQLENVLSY
jgi:hypothetical protein